MEGTTLGLGGLCGGGPRPIPFTRIGLVEACLP